MANIKFWTTKSGQKLKICDMETSHIQNCIKMLERDIATLDEMIGWEHFAADQFGATNPMSAWSMESAKKRKQTIINIFKNQLKTRSRLRI